MSMEKLLNERYAVKKFDTSYKLTEGELSEIKALLQLAPSSVNIQPWHFTIAITNESIEKIAKSTKDFAFNKDKIKEASALVVFSVINMTTAHLKAVIEKEDQDGRYATEQYKIDSDKGRQYFYSLNKEGGKEELWLNNQVYLNAGYFTLGVASLGLDTVIMEGFDPNIVVSELNLKEQTPLLIVAVGKSAKDDFNASLPKSRLAQDHIIDII